MQTVLHWVTLYGYEAIFFLLVLGIVGLPIPDETLLTFAGYLVFKGHLRLLPTLAAAFLGSLCGITLSYVLGRTFGLYLVRHYGHYVRLTDEKIHQAHDWFRRAGRWSLTFGYFLPGIRHLTAYVAGASELELPVFALFAYTGGCIWSVTFISIGYFLGEEWAQATQWIRRTLLIGTGVALVILAGYSWVQRTKKRLGD